MRFQAVMDPSCTLWCRWWVWLSCLSLLWASLFNVLGKIITMPTFHGNIKEELEMLKFEESAIQHRYKLHEREGVVSTEGGVVSTGGRLAMEEGANLEQLITPVFETTLVDTTPWLLHMIAERSLCSSPWERNCAYPLCFLFLLAMTVLALALVAVNILALIISPQQHLSVQEYLLGTESTSTLGFVGAGLEAGLIVYFMCASVVGVYSTPRLHSLLPTPHSTPMTKVIANCIILLVLSSALPLLSQNLGITKFHLLGHFGDLEWLRNPWLLFSYNILFLVVTTVILCLKVTRSIMKEADRIKTSAQEEIS